MPYIACRVMTFNGRKLNPGDLIDEKECRYPNILMAAGYIRKAPDISPASNPIKKNTNEIPAKVATNQAAEKTAVKQTTATAKVTTRSQTTTLSRPTVAKTATRVVKKGE